ncbi:hypothetical protein WISP_00052 [Willisornis vidua]|uniref:IPIL1 protein n=1 Tax=Willisornis vidua TaxID=1566151 RepID=A0ABQ9DZX9_9PASS|nr:hypothetical protein WISP_00052 [Willisornis vidua]
MGMNHILNLLIVCIKPSKSILKTVVMHLLNTVPVSWWDSRQFLQRLGDTMQYLHCSVLQKCLDHFIVGNQSLPEVIRLPTDIQNSVPPNLFHHLLQELVEYTLAMRDYRQLQNHIRRIVLFDN